MNASWNRRGAALTLFIAFTAAVVGADEPWRRHTVDASSRGADGVRLADANSDGLPDIVTGWEEGGVIRLYLNPGPQRSRDPWPAATVGRVRSPEDAVMTDLDGDGAMDVVSCCEGGTKTVYVHWGPSDRRRMLDDAAWRTEPIPATAGRQMWMFALPLQVDGRGGVDLVVGSKGNDASIGWLRSPDDPRRLADWTWHELTPAGWIMSLQAHDMDGDGDLDILASDRKGPRRGVVWLEHPQGRTAGGAKRSDEDRSDDAESNDSGVRSEWPIHRIGGDGREVMFLSCRKSPDGRTSENSERRFDIFAAVTPRSILRLTRRPVQLTPSGRDAGPNAKSDSNRNAAAFDWRGAEIPFPAGCGTAKGVAVGDIDLDGAADLVFSCENASGELSGVRWLKHGDAANSQRDGGDEADSRDSAGTTKPIIDDRWRGHEISGPQGVKFDRIELLDLDGDGDLDVLTCEERDNLGVIWYENPAR